MPRKGNEMKTQEQKDRQGSIRMTIVLLLLLVILAYISSFFMMGS